MRLTKEALSIKVVIRRANKNAKTFVWEINRDTMIEPIYVSPDTFKSMEAAYTAGQARLAEFIATARSSSEVLDTNGWQLHQSESEVTEGVAFIKPSYTPTGSMQTGFE